jgi:hypothetical protein
LSEAGPDQSPESKAAVGFLMSSLAGFMLIIQYLVMYIRINTFEWISLLVLALLFFLAGMFSISRQYNWDWSRWD